MPGRPQFQAGRNGTDVYAGTLKEQLNWRLLFGGCVRLCLPIQRRKDTTMDPNETLARLRELAEKPVSLDTCEEMQGLFDDLDQWLSKGGFAPAAWPLVVIAR